MDFVEDDDLAEDEEEEDEFAAAPVSAEVTYLCAVCGRKNDAFVDADGGEHQELQEECTYCMQPNLVHAGWMDDVGEWDVWAEAEEN